MVGLVMNFALARKLDGIFNSSQPIAGTQSSAVVGREANRGIIAMRFRLRWVEYLHRFATAIKNQQIQIAAKP